MFQVRGTAASPSRTGKEDAHQVAGRGCGDAASLEQGADQAHPHRLQADGGTQREASNMF